jgi:hypothetical protein
MKRFASILVFSTIALAAPKALADQVYSGNALYFVTTTTSSDFSNQWAGYVGVNGSTGLLNFFWGGSNCTNITPITSTQFEILSRAAMNKQRIDMYYKRVGSASCITGFALFG